MYLSNSFIAREYFYRRVLTLAYFYLKIINTVYIYCVYIVNDKVE